MYPKKLDDDDANRITDLASIAVNGIKDREKYICKDCKSVELLDYPEAVIENPFAGPSYLCPSCNKVYDSSIERLQHKSKPIRSSLGQTTAEGDNIAPLFETIPERSSFRVDDDEYERLDPEGDTDERMKMEGWHITHSEIDLTDKQGRNRKVVKRQEKEDLSLGRPKNLLD